MANKYNYSEVIKEEMIKWLQNNLIDNYIEEIEADEYTLESLRDFLYDTFWEVDEITGNETVDGYPNLSTLEKGYAVVQNTEYLKEVRDELGIDENRVWDWNYLDTSLRCYFMVRVLNSDAIEAEIKNIVADYLDQTKDTLTEEEIENIQTFLES